MQLIYGLCLPLAALIGFFLADPLQSGSLGVLAIVAGVLGWPIFVRWYHPLLVGSIHSAFILGFLPGNLPLWTALAAGGCMVAMFHRSLNPEVRLWPPGGVPWALLTLGAVVVLTALMRGGVGFRALGSASMGSKKIIFVVTAIMAYFALVSRPVPRKWAMVYVGLFCLSGMTSLLSHLVYFAGGGSFWLFQIIDPAPAAAQAAADWDVQGSTMVRSTAGMSMAGSLIGLFLAWFGLRELLNLKKPWRLLLLLACLAGGLLGGFRSFLVGAVIMLAIIFFLEGLHRTRYLAGAAALALAGYGLLAAYSNDLPLSAQRAISFLPVRIDPHVRQDAQGSLDWRLQMWEVLLRDVPRYLPLGKGYAIDPGDLYLSGFNANMGFGIQAEWAVLAGEYHNGPLSVLIPFGLWGAVGFVWLLVAAALRLRWFCHYGDPGLMRINRALFAMFLTKIIFFLFFFGSFYSELVEFVVLIGLAECLNPATATPVEPEDVPVPDLRDAAEEG
jgi:hypothetical protein